MNAVSDTLFHFLDRAHENEPEKQFDTFTSIIKKGLLFSSISENLGSTTFANTGICFTDIPLGMSEEHTKVYGKFGIGFKKEFVKNMGGNPAFYFDDWNYVNSFSENKLRGQFTDAIKEVAKLTLYLSEMEKNGEKVNTRFRGNPICLTTYANPLRQVLSNLKSCGDLGPASDNTNRNDAYYKEREWRILYFLKHKELGYVNGEGRRIEGKGYIEKIYLKINPSKDIRIIVTPNEDIRKKVINFFLKDGDSFIPTIINYDDFSKL